VRGVLVPHRPAGAIPLVCRRQLSPESAVGGVTHGFELTVLLVVVKQAVAVKIAALNVECPACIGERCDRKISESVLISLASQWTATACARGKQARHRRSTALAGSSSASSYTRCLGEASSRAAQRRPPPPPLCNFGVTVPHDTHRSHSWTRSDFAAADSVPSKTRRTPSISSISSTACGVPLDEELPNALLVAIRIFSDETKQLF